MQSRINAACFFINKSFFLLSARRCLGGRDIRLLISDSSSKPGDVHFISKLNLIEATCAISLVDIYVES